MSANAPALPTTRPTPPDCDCGGGNDGRVWHDSSCPWNPRNLYLRRRALEEAELVRAAAR